ncbi:anti-sigma factor [Actinospica robiniae]|uniref:anti-sigma factor n=1 Tax=Actinospica robiniae TaxID=304901 RepID=UPI0007C508D4|nr:anti-sigma factor [Actinospica robiniae]
MAGPGVHTLTGAYVCDALGEAERAAFEAHMAQCADCAAEVRELREVVAIMAMAVAQQPPGSLKDGLDAQIAVTRQLPPITDEGSDPQTQTQRQSPAQRQAQRRSSKRRLRAGWAVAAALALLAAGLGWRTIDQQHQLDSLNARSTQISQLLAAPDAATARVKVTGGGTALLIDSRQLDEAAVGFTGLAGAPAGKTYQLWLMTPDGKARSVALMSTDPATPVVIRGLTGEANVGMTIEPAGGSPQPTTTPVMVAALGGSD